MTMKKFFLIIAGLCCAVLCAAQMRFRPRVEADYEYLFHNREFAYSGETIATSETVHLVRYTPAIGFNARTGRFKHAFRLGFDLAYNLGSRDLKSIPQEPVAYYDLRMETGKGRFEGVAGIFPRAFACQGYSEAIWSDYYKLTDRFMEGLLLKYRSETFRSELGCDWMEFYGDNHRERFQIISYGEWSPLKWLSAGWQLSAFHYANYIITPTDAIAGLGAVGGSGVADNHIVKPFLKLGLPERGKLKELSLSAGPVLAYQWERRQQELPSLLYGGESVLTLKLASLNVRNTVYLGQELQPLRAMRDKNGDLYGNNLYFGDPFYSGFLDKLHIAWEPRIGRFLSFTVGADAYFCGNGFAGWTQTIGLRLKCK